ncbi:MAG: hypothetical protein K8S87_10960 [Planctomycetes bacterium]|nr:hypothetical protein [Planctomycetota bacterium]
MKLQICLLTLILLICLCSQTFAEGERVDAKCEVGFGNTVKIHYWHNLNVTLTNHYPQRIEALVTVIRKITDQPTLIMKQSVTLDSGERSIPIKLEFLCPPVKDIIGLQYLILVDDAKTSRNLMKYYNKRYKQVKRNNKKIWVGKWLVREEINLAVNLLSQNEEQILTVNAGSSLRFIRLAVEQYDFNAKEFDFVNRRMEDIPTNWLALSGIKVIILNNPEIKKLQFGGRDKALEDWVHAGGTLMLIMSEKVEEYKSLPIVKLSGVRLKTLETVNETAQEIYRFYDIEKRWFNLGATLQCIDAEIEDPENTVTSFWARNNRNEKSKKHLIPIVNTRWVGAGRIVTVLMDMRNTLDYQLNGYLYKQFIQPVFVNVSGGSEVVDVQKAMGNSINNILQAKPIRFGIIALFIGIYMLVVAFVDFLLLRVMSILHWTWFSVLIWVVAFSIIADRIGETYRGGDMSMREIVVADSGLGGEITRFNEFAGVFSQQNQSYTVFHDNENSGVTRLERLIENNDNRFIRGNNYQKNQSYDADTEFSIAQPADSDELKHQGAFIKSVILPRWVIRDIQAQSLMNSDTKKGLKIEYIDTFGFFDLNSNTYSDEKFQFTVGRDVQVVKRIRIKNNNKYPIDGLCIVYSKGKVVTFPGRINSGESTDLFYHIKHDVIFADNSEHTIVSNKSSEWENDEYDRYGEEPSTASTDGSCKLIIEDIISNENIRDIARSLLNDNHFKVFQNSRNEMRMPKEALVVLLASGRKFSQVRAESNKESKNKLFIQNKAYDFLDVSHRIESGDTIIISWTNWHINNETKDSGDKEVDSEIIDIRNPGDVANERYRIKMNKYSYKYPSIKFEGWKAQSSRFIVNRIFAKPIELCFSKK